MTTASAEIRETADTSPMRDSVGTAVNTTLSLARSRTGVDDCYLLGTEVHNRSCIYIQENLNNNSGSWAYSDYPTTHQKRPIKNQTLLLRQTTATKAHSANCPLGKSKRPTIAVPKSMPLNNHRHNRPHRRRSTDHHTRLGSSRTTAGSRMIGSSRSWIAAGSLEIGRS